jgi:hypothetical protein
MNDNLVENLLFDPFEFRFANGTTVKLVFAHFWERISSADRREGAIAQKYFAIRIYSNENRLSGHLVLQSELRAEHEFRLSSLTSTWEWLHELVDTRRHINYEDLDDFVEDLTRHLEELLNEDAVEHYEHLSTLNDPEAFDRVDDSVFNDQKDNQQEN